LTREIPNWPGGSHGNCRGTGPPSGPFGAKGVGETGITKVAPSIADALYDAVGARIHSLPMTPEKVLDALEARQGQERSSHEDDRSPSAP
jgi:hypothetical protein